MNVLMNIADGRGSVRAHVSGYREPGRSHI